MIQASTHLAYVAIESRLSEEADIFDIADLLDTTATAVIEPPHLDWDEAETELPPRPRLADPANDPWQDGIY